MSDQQHWLRLLQKERDARESVRDSAGREGTGERLRAWWKTVRDLLDEYARSIARREIHEPPPAEVIKVIADLSGELAVGSLPFAMRAARAEGQTPPAPAEERMIGTAVAYWQACRPEGLQHNGETIRIDDPDPVERIHLWYGAGKRTVYEWVKQKQPAFLGVNDINASTIIEQTIRMAERYRKMGRSHGAVRRRAKKRSSAVN